MRILFTRFPLESRRGGAENQTLWLMEGLLKHGHAVSFLGSCTTLLAMCTERNIPHAELHIGAPPVSKRAAITFPWRKAKMVVTLQAALDQFEHLDAVFMLSLSEKILLTPHALKKGIKVFWVEHDTVGRWLLKNPWLPILRTMSRDVTTVCVSDLSAEIYRELKIQNVVAIPNGVPRPSGFVPNAYDGTLRVGCIARLSPEKGVDVLVDAAKDMENVRLIINGMGSQNIRTEKNMEVRAHVTDIEEMYRDIDVLVLPSRVHDPFGLVVAEAMLRGIPTICTTACGISRHIRSGQEALVVDAGSVSALQKAILSMQDPVLREGLSKNGKRAAEERFTREKMVESYVGLLTRAG